MDDLLQSQIKESCRLALPNGLKELMSDISREVLRAQPPKLYEFIEKYLAALLVTRENLSIAGRLCQEVCSPTCHPELEDELKHIFLDEEDAEKAKKLIQDYFDAGKADESNLMVKLLRRFSIPQDHLELVQDAVRRAFLHQNINTTDNILWKLPPDVDEVTHAAIHTMQLYAATGPSEEDYHQKAQRIQAAYKAYGVRRLCTSKPIDRKAHHIRFSAEAAYKAYGVRRLCTSKPIDRKAHHIRFSAEIIDRDITPGSSQTGIPESQARECESATVHKTASQMVLSEAEMSHEKVSRHERMLSQINYDLKFPERVQSFVNYEDEKEKRVMSVTDEAVEKGLDVDDNNGNTRKVSNISEVHFSKPLIYDELRRETIDDHDPDDDEFSDIEEHAVVFYDAHHVDDQTVDDQAVEADNESDDSIEEDIEE